jgi:hypothetical protein
MLSINTVKARATFRGFDKSRCIWKSISWEKVYISYLCAILFICHLLQRLNTCRSNSLVIYTIVFANVKFQWLLYVPPVSTFINSEFSCFENKRKYFSTINWLVLVMKTYRFYHLDETNSSKGQMKTKIIQWHIFILKKLY